MTAMTMRDYARFETAALLRRVALQVDRAAQSADADAIHDLRVAVRRLSRCLRVFAQFYPGRSWKKLRRELSVLMDSAGAVRDCDIAVTLLAEAGLSARSGAVSRLAAERRKQSRTFLREVKNWRRRRLSRQWHRKLEL
jgi:CHAD domain-containing protein